YFYWPVYSTMNREFSKGLRLYLTPHARVQSTFGGHYDLAAYLVILLPLLLALTFAQKNKFLKTVMWAVHLMGMWLMVMTAARTSFVAYLVGSALVIVGWSLTKTGWWQRIGWSIKQFLLLDVLILMIMINFGDDLYNRFLQTLEQYPELHTIYHRLNREKNHYTEKLIVALGIKKLEVAKPVDGVSVDQAAVMESRQITDVTKIDQVLVPSDERPSSEKPSDVFVDVPDQVIVNTTNSDGSVTTSIVEKDRVWSENALKHGLSLGIRLDTLWPRAVAGFLRNPFFGSGYATLNKEGPSQFTEAESTDNNFLRTLGETGALGFITFYGIIILAIKMAWKLTQTAKGWEKAIGWGIIGGSVGLLINALYIDVYAASKVAFTYWAVIGLLNGAVNLNQAKFSISNTLKASATKLEQATPSKKTKRLFKHRRATTLK
ncbi:MAG: O-antigen polymerase, partial [Parcubacteria group bacterium GW2011_GWF2_44_8]